MQKEDYEHVENVLRELSLFLREKQQQDADVIKEAEKAQFKRLFYFVGETSDSEVKKIRQAQDAYRTLNFPPTWNNEDLQLNKTGRKTVKTDETHFNKKELKEMPKLKDLHYRYKEKDCRHEFRYRRNGHNRSFSSRNYNEAKRKAVEFIRELNFQEGNTILNTEVMFNDFASDFLQFVKKKNVTEKTFYNEYNRFKNHIMPAFKNVRLKHVNGPFIQKFLNDYVDKGQGRTAEALYYILRMVFNYAIDNDVIQKSPMRAVAIPMSERTVGQALTYDDEKAFVKNIVGTPYELHFILLLYTGCRPCELYTVSFEKPGFVTFRNRKQKKKKIAYKDIPITPMLEPYVERIKSALPLRENTELTKRFKDLCPKYRMYDLRHTFATRCQICGVSQPLVQRWLGHASDKLVDNTYTHFPEEFILKEAKKVEY